jgi:hypothetical protein
LAGPSERGGSYQTGPVSYSYSFFHLIFALASMYLAMLMTGWGTHNAADAEQVDVVRRCRLTVSQHVLRAPMDSALETR